MLSGLKYKVVSKDTTEIRFGETGWQFYIILDGKCSVWVPIPNPNMIPILSELLKSGLEKLEFFEYKDA